MIGVSVPRKARSGLDASISLFFFSLIVNRFICYSKFFSLSSLFLLPVSAKRLQDSIPAVRPSSSSSPARTATSVSPPSSNASMKADKRAVCACAFFLSFFFFLGFGDSLYSKKVVPFSFFSFLKKKKKERVLSSCKFPFGIFVEPF